MASPSPPPLHPPPAIKASTLPPPAEWNYSVCQEFLHIPDSDFHALCGRLRRSMAQHPYNLLEVGHLRFAANKALLEHFLTAWMSDQTPANVDIRAGVAWTNEGLSLPPDYRSDGLRHCIREIVKNIRRVHRAQGREKTGESTSSANVSATLRKMSASNTSEHLDKTLESGRRNSTPGMTSTRVNSAHHSETIPPALTPVESESDITSTTPTPQAPDSLWLFLMELRFHKNDTLVATLRPFDILDPSMTEEVAPEELVPAYLSYAMMITKLRETSPSDADQALFDARRERIVVLTKSSYLFVIDSNVKLQNAIEHHLHFWVDSYLDMCIVHKDAAIQKSATSMLRTYLSSSRSQE